VEMTELMENAESHKQASRVSHSSLEISPTTRDSPIPTASTTARPDPNQNPKTRGPWKSGNPNRRDSHFSTAPSGALLAAPNQENQTCRSLTYRGQKLVLTLGATFRPS
jgi:hypothetical protein